MRGAPRSLFRSPELIDIYLYNVDRCDRAGAIEGATYDDEQGGYKFPTDATIPDVEFAVGDTLYKVNPKDIAFGDAGDGFVFGGIQSRGNLDFDIFGDVFLKSVYVVCEWSAFKFLAREDCECPDCRADAVDLLPFSQPGRVDGRPCAARRLDVVHNIATRYIPIPTSTNA